jgi:hypothetical protein
VPAKVLRKVRQLDLVPQASTVSRGGGIALRGDSWHVPPALQSFLEGKNLLASRAKAACDDLHEAIILVDREVVMSKRPSKPKQIVEIDLRRPRDVIDVHADPAVGVCFKQLWSARDAH